MKLEKETVPNFKKKGLEKHKCNKLCCTANNFIQLLFKFMFMLQSYMYV